MAILPSTSCTFEPWKLNSKPSWSTAAPALPHRLKLLTRVDAITTAGFRELLQSGTVRSVAPKDANSTMRSEGFVLLDVRPVWEREKARVEGSLNVPLFVEDTDMSPVTLLKKWVHFGYIGLWTGQYFTTINDQFLSQVEALVPDKGAKLLVSCGEGLRSMMAIRRLHDGGYQNLGGWQGDSIAPLMTIFLMWKGPPNYSMPPLVVSPTFFSNCLFYCKRLVVRAVVVVLDLIL